MMEFSSQFSFHLATMIIGIIFSVLQFDAINANYEIKLNFSQPDSSLVSLNLDKAVNFVDERFVGITLDTSLIADHWPCFDFGQPDSSLVSLNLDKAVNFVDERFVGITLDTSLIADHWPCFDFGSPRLLTMAKVVSPGYLRLGGSAADFLMFREHGTLVRNKHHKCSDDENRRNFSTFYMEDSDFDNINEFAVNAGLRLIFDLNSLVRKLNNEWNSSNAEMLLKYAIKKNYTQNLDLELGNEPNAYFHAYHRNVSAPQLGLDFQSLKMLLDKLPQFNNSLLVGPAVTQPKTTSLEYLSQFLKSAQHSIDAITVHHYYLDGRTATVNQMMSVKVLNSLSKGLDKLLETVQLAGYGDVPVWLGETGSCWGGGAPGLSDSYVAGFMWLDKLGVAAQRGISVVLRQSFFHGHYAMVDKNMNPNPDFWVTWLYKRLVGQKVLAVNSTSDKSVRVYAHCTCYKSSSYPKGSVTLFVLNLSDTNKTVIFDNKLFQLQKHVYWLLPHGKSGLKSKLVSLSDRVLRLVNNFTLPEPLAVVLDGSRPVNLPASSYGFIVIPDASALVCQEPKTSSTLRNKRR